MTRDVSQSLGGLQNLPIIVRPADNQFRNQLTGITRNFTRKVSEHRYKLFVSSVLGGIYMLLAGLRCSQTTPTPPIPWGGVRMGLVILKCHTIQTREFILTSDYPYQLGKSVIYYCQPSSQNDAHRIYSMSKVKH